MSILNRISIIQEDSNLSERAFELSINKTSGYLNMMRKRNSNPGADVLAIILKVYPKYSAEWLLTGEGEKCKKTDALVNEPSALYGKPTIEKAVKELEQWVVGLINNQTDERFKKLNSDVMMLLKRDLRALEELKKEEKNAS